MSAVDVTLDRTPLEERGRRASRTVSLIVLFLAVAGGTGGTWAAFSASTSNNATVTTGLLLMSNQREAAPVCFSTAEGDAIDENIGACDALFTLDTRKPGDTDSVRITLKNEGNIEATTLQAFATGACTTGNATTTGFHGDEATICDDLQLMVQEYTSQANQGADNRAGGACRYGVDADANGQCDGFDASRTLDHFDTAYPDFNQAIALGSMPAGQTRWFRVFLKLDPAASNGVQGRAADFGITWRAAQ